MLADADRFLAAYRAKLAATATASSGRVEGGYATYGRYTLGEKGTEFVMTNSATRAAENIIGGRLTQDALLGALARGAGEGRSLTINDHSRFDGRISASQVRAIKQETIGALVKEISRA